MLHWICPECGRECPPEEYDCPICHPVAVAAGAPDLAVAGQAHTGAEASGSVFGNGGAGSSGQLNLSVEELQELPTMQIRIPDALALLSKRMAPSEPTQLAPLTQLIGALVPSGTIPPPESSGPLAITGGLETLYPGPAAEPTPAGMACPGLVQLSVALTVAQHDPGLDCEAAAKVRIVVEPTVQALRESFEAEPAADESSAAEPEASEQIRRELELPASSKGHQSRAVFGLADCVSLPSPAILDVPLNGVVLDSVSFPAQSASYPIPMFFGPDDAGYWELAEKAFAEPVAESIASAAEREAELVFVDVAPPAVEPPAEEAADSEPVADFVAAGFETIDDMSVEVVAADMLPVDAASADDFAVEAPAVEAEAQLSENPVSTTQQEIDAAFAAELASFNADPDSKIVFAPADPVPAPIETKPDLMATQAINVADLWRKAEELFGPIPESKPIPVETAIPAVVESAPETVIAEKIEDTPAASVEVPVVISEGTPAPKKSKAAKSANVRRVNVPSKAKPDEPAAPATEAAVEPIPEPVADPTPEAVPELVSEPAPEPIPVAEEPAPAPEIIPAPEPVATSASAPEPAIPVLTPIVESSIPAFQNFVATRVVPSVKESVPMRMIVQVVGQFSPGPPMLPASLIHTGFKLIKLTSSRAVRSSGVPMWLLGGGVLAAAGCAGVVFMGKPAGANATPPRAGIAAPASTAPRTPAKQIPAQPTAAATGSDSVRFRSNNLEVYDIKVSLRNGVPFASFTVHNTVDAEISNVRMNILLRSATASIYESALGAAIVQIPMLKPEETRRFAAPVEAQSDRPLPALDRIMVDVQVIEQ